MDKALLVELNYLAPISYYSFLKKHSNIILEKQESFLKSTYRNRCEILGANGRQTLSIPVKGGRSKNQPYASLSIDNTQNWKRIHWNSICSAYGRSPYFEHYRPYFEKHYAEKWESLYAFNLALLELSFNLLKWDKEISFTHVFEKKSSQNHLDLRDFIDSNKNMTDSAKGTEKIKYLQVFNDRFAFEENLSILDLLFNEGPNADSFL